MAFPHLPPYHECDEHLSRLITNLCRVPERWLQQLSAASLQVSQHTNSTHSVPAPSFAQTMATATKHTPLLPVQSPVPSDIEIAQAVKPEHVSHSHAKTLLRKPIRSRAPHIA